MTLENNDLKIEKINTEADVKRCRKEIEQLRKERKFNAVIEKIISMFQAGHTDKDLMVDLAEIYYETQDYERAEKWATNAFNKDNALDTLLFLAKIYSADDKIEKMALALDLVLENATDSLSNEQSKTIEDLLFYIELSYDEDEINEKFPNAGKWIKQEETSECGSNNIVVAEDTVEDDIKINKINDEKVVEIVADKKLDFDLNVILKKVVDGIDIDDEEYRFLESCAIDEIVMSIENLNVSLNKKILIYNFVASVYYNASKLLNSITALKTALIIDDQNELILKNLGFVFYKQGDKENASIVLKAIENKDFMVCEILQNCIA